MDTDEGPGKIYRSIKARMMRFLQTATERQLRVKHQRAALQKGRYTTAQQFEAVWELATREMSEVGLTLSPLDLFLSYLVNVGGQVAETLRLDRRPREDTKDPSAGFVNRVAETWEELHFVLCELEGVRAGARALGAARAAALRDGDPQKGKAKGKGKGKHDDGGKAPGVCFEMRDKGACSRGGHCKYSHEPRDTGRPSGAVPPQKKKPKAKAGGQEQESLPHDAGYQGKKGKRQKGKGKGKGKDGKGQYKGDQQWSPPKGGGKGGGKTGRRFSAGISRKVSHSPPAGRTAHTVTTKACLTRRRLNTSGNRKAS